MAKITVKGESSMRVSADCMEISISFKGKSANTNDAIQASHRQCELFLEELESCKIDTEKIILHDDSIRKNDFGDTETTTVERTINFRVPADLKLESYILRIIKENNMDCNYNVDFTLADIDAIENTLIKDAITDSRNKAELIANALDKKIVGVEEVQKSGYRRARTRKCIMEEDYLEMPQFLSDTPKSDKLAVTEIEREQAVEIVWIIE